MLFLPGARGDRGFWRPVADLLPAAYERVFLEWPGHGHVPPNPAVRSFDDLVRLVTARMERGPVDLIAQSMGGAVAIRAALERPAMVRHLVLCATSGGIDLTSFGTEEWRPSYREEYPAAASAVLLEHRDDLAERIRTITAPTLLLWGDSDPISPVAVGEYLGSLLPRSKLIVIPGGAHAFAEEQPELVAPYIASHLALDVS